MLDLPLCFSALGCSRSLCGSRGSLLNDHKELSSKPESSKSSPNTCEAWPNPSSKRLKSQFRWLQSLAHTEKKKVVFLLFKLSPSTNSFPLLPKLQTRSMLILYHGFCTSITQEKKLPSIRRSKQRKSQILMHSLHNNNDDFKKILDAYYERGKYRAGDRNSVEFWSSKLWHFYCLSLSPSLITCLWP